MKIFLKLFGLIALAAVIGFSMIACDDGSGSNPNTGNGNTGINVPGVGELPDFPSGSTPAATKADAEAILAEFRESRLANSIDAEIWEVVYENSPNDGNYSFNDKSLPNGYIKASASLTENETSTGGFKTLFDNEDYNAIIFAINDRTDSTATGHYKGEITRSRTENSVSIVKGSLIEFEQNWNNSESVSTAGTYETFKININGSDKYQQIAALTISSSNGSIKVIFNGTSEAKFSGNNIHYTKGFNGENTIKQKCSGSLKVYGNNNALLIEQMITDSVSLRIARDTLYGGLYPFNPDNAIPLTDNTKVTGLITSANPVAWYSINVTKGTKYYLWFSSGSLRGYSTDFCYDCDVSYSWPNGENSPELIFTPALNGTVYFKISSEEDTGDFSIAYNTTGIRP